MPTAAMDNEIHNRINAALWRDAMTQQVVIGTSVLDAVGGCFQEQFGDVPALVVADSITYAAAGRQVQNQLAGSLPHLLEPFVFEDANLYAEYGFVERLRTGYRQRRVAIAVGAGTINDLAKLASGECQAALHVGRHGGFDGWLYLVRRSVTREGYKQTLPCPAPLAVVVDLDLLAAAPPRLNAAGYADLFAKVPSGADWIVADALGIEPIEAHSWSLTQGRLPWLGDPAAVKQRRSSGPRRID